MRALFSCLLLLAPMAFADDDTPPLTPAQQAKLKKLQALFEPGGKVNSMTQGIDKSEALCGARIPLELHPSTVALEKLNGDRTIIDTTCNDFAASVVFTCGTIPEQSDPVVKELIRTNIRRLVCRATKNKQETDRGPGMTNYGVKFSLEDGTFTMTYVADGASNITDLGKRFLAENVRSAEGLSIGGQQLKRKMLQLVSKSELRERIKEKCGLDLDVQLDDKLMEHYSHHPTHAPLGVCDSGLQVIYNNCASDGVSNLEITSPEVKRALLANLKGVSCVYSDDMTASVKPNGILEFGTSDQARTPPPSRSAESFLFSWMKTNVKALGAKAAPAKHTK